MRAIQKQVDFNKYDGGEPTVVSDTLLYTLSLSDV
jgi:hypothetical protein